ncbi:MAG: histidine phosphatase family protein [bacterium]
MKTIELRRHSTKSGPGNHDLSEAGIALAHRIGKEELHGKNFTLLFDSPLKRAKDTLNAFKEGALDFPDVQPQLFPPLMEVALQKSAMELWNGVCNHAEERDEDMMQAALENEPALTNTLAKEAAASFLRWIASLPDDTNALVVGHSPFFEMIALGLFDEVLPQLQPCEGFRIIEENGALRLEK